MTEQNQKKKQGKIKPILRWINLVLLALLLTISIVFQVTWKITTILVIVLLACTLLPRRHRKWFWLSAAVVLVVLLVWILLPDGDDTWVPFTFVEELAAHEARYAVPENQNAATIYNELLQDYIPEEWRIRFLERGAYNQTLSEPWRSKDYPALAQWIDRHRATISALPEACRIKMCRFASNFRISPTDPAEAHRYSALKSWALILLLSANNDVAEGRTEEGFLKYIHALQIAEHLYQQKRIYDFLIGFGIEGITLPRINRFVVESNVSKEQLQFLTETLGTVEKNWQEDFSRCLEYDRLFVKNAFCSLVYQTDSNGRTRFNRDPAAAIRGHYGPRLPVDTYWQRKSMKAYTILAWLLLPLAPRKAAEMIDAVFEQYYPMADPDFAWDTKANAQFSVHSPNYLFLVRPLINRTTLQYDGFRKIYPKMLLHRRGTRVLVALKQYRIDNGRWPESLDAIKSSAPAEALIEPVNNGPFIYKTADDSFTLYSKGENNLDENGKSDKWSFQDQGPDDWLFWPPKERKNDQINTTNNITPPQGQ